jgi:hypothetical protein
MAAEAVASTGEEAAVLVAVFQEAAFAAAAASQVAALEAAAVLAAPTEVQPPLRVWARIPMQVRWEDLAGMAQPTVAPQTEGRVRMAPLAAAALPIMRDRELTRV